MRPGEPRCAVDGCDRERCRRDWCDPHYRRWLRYGDPLAARALLSSCKVEGCDRKVLGHGWCGAHYQRWKRHGDPLGGGTSPGEPLAWLRTLAAAPPTDECVPWPYARISNGYGHVKHDGRLRMATHVILELVGRPRPDGSLEAAHSCGNGHEGCTNPAHLRWATPKENAADKIGHGTAPRGELHGHSKLTEGDVLAIRADPRTQAVIAADYGVSSAYVSQIKSGKRWSWLDDEVRS